MCPTSDPQAGMEVTESSQADREEEQHVDEEPLYEEIDPDFEDTNGAFKTDNPKGKRWQRRFVHVENKMSKFRKTVETVLVVHGWKTPEKTEPMTLIILSVSLNCHAKNFRFQSVRMWLAFDEDREANLTDEEASPEVVAYAPFVSSQDSWNPSDENVEKETTTGLTLGVEKYVKAGVEHQWEAKRSYTRTHFDRGSADWMVDKDQKTYGVNWYFEQNKLQKYGVKPHFHIAILVKRQHAADGKPIPFSGVFDMRVEAGFIHDFDEARRRIFRLGKPADEAVYYDPNLEDQAHGLNSDGERLKTKVKKEHLGELIGGPDGDWLSTLIDPTGSLSGLEPIEPKTD